MSFLDDKLIELENLLIELNSTSIGRKTFLAAMPAMLAACATTEKTRTREGDNTGQETEITVEDEKKMTQEVLPQMRKDYPAINNPDMQNYINNLGQKIVRSNNLNGNPYNYNFTVVGVSYVNAFALPAGTVFVTAPLIAMADTEAELAGVVGHEVGHIKARHTAERMDVAKKEESKTWKYAVGGGVIGGLAGLGLGAVMCKNETGGSKTTCMAKYAAIGGAAGAAGGLLIQKYSFMANSREDEMEADRIGFRTSVGANFSKDKVGDFYEKLLEMEKQSKGNSNEIVARISDAMSTHPPSKERVEQMKQLAAESPQKSNAIVSSNEFDRIKRMAVEWSNQNPPKRG
ncbi:MAG: M48 family metalloprotease [Leptospiraceae bacterium]|nr:M48 family metalloprotease [Leptospiraceae bacterium]MCP5497505.1 M48 family metalloprotease [Leptospiraceae bacterium]